MPPTRDHEVVADAPSRRGLLGVILIVGLALRVVYVLTARLNVETGFQYDMMFYRNVAGNLAAGRGYRFFWKPTAMWPPGYPVFLAAVHLVAPGGWLAAQLAQAVLGTITCAGTFVLGRAIFGERAGLWAAALLAICPEAIAFTPLLLSETLFATLWTWWLVLLVTASRSAASATAARWLALGLLAGLATLVRGVGLLAPVIAVSAWLASGVGLRVTFGRTAWMGGALVLALLPWTIRNAKVLGAPIAVSTELGEVMSVAHSPIATGGLTSWEPESPVDFLRRQAVASATRVRRDDLPPDQREAAVSRDETWRAIQWVLDNPGRELSLILPRVAFLYRNGRAAYLWGRVVEGDKTLPLYDPTWDERLMTASDWHFYALLVLGLAGMLTPRLRAAPWHLVLFFTIAWVTVLHGVVLFGDPRFHFPLLPVLATLSGGFLAWLAGRRSRAAGGGLSSDPARP